MFRAFSYSFGLAQWPPYTHECENSGFWFKKNDSSPRISDFPGLDAAQPYSTKSTRALELTVLCAYPKTNRPSIESFPTRGRAMWPQSNEAEHLAAEEFDRLMLLAEDGDEHSCQRLFDQHHRFVLHVIRHHLLPDDPLRQRFDSDDLAMVLWEKVFERIRAGGSFESPQQFINYLRGMGRYVYLEIRRNHICAAKRSLQREERAPERELRARGEFAGDPAALAANEDEWQSMLAKRNITERLVLEALRNGESRVDVAVKFKISLSTLKRIVAKCARGGTAADNQVTIGKPFFSSFLFEERLP